MTDADLLFARVIDLLSASWLCCKANTFCSKTMQVKAKGSRKLHFNEFLSALEFISQRRELPIVKVGSVCPGK
jgi:hypothetical protein